MFAFSLADLAVLAADPVVWASLATLIAMEVVLGIDNLIFISIVTNRLPVERRDSARRIGIGLALILRLALLGTVAFIVTLTTPVFTHARPRLLVARSDPDRRRTVPGLEGDQGNSSSRRSRSRPGRVRPGRRGRFVRRGDRQILVLDMVFSVDSIITAVGMTPHRAGDGDRGCGGGAA